MRVSYRGGPVVSCPVLFATFWGRKWLDENGNLNADTQKLEQFLNDLVHNSRWMNMLNQYGISGGMFAQSLPVDVDSVGNSDDVERGIRAQLLSPVDGHPPRLPAPSDPRSSPPIVMCFPDNSTNAFAGSGFHGHFISANGQPLIYAVVFFQQQRGQIDINAMTRIASHEFAELVTNPIGSARPNDPQAGWIDPSLEVENEIADICQGGPGFIEQEGRSWSVESIWSEAKGQCSLGSDTPLPPIHPGPFTLSAAAQPRKNHALSRADVQASRRLTPLPPIYVDPETKRPIMRKTDLFAYYRRVFYPLRHEMIYPNLPNFLRELASVIEQGTRRSGK